MHSTQGGVAALFFRTAKGRSYPNCQSMSAVFLSFNRKEATMRVIILAQAVTPQRPQRLYGRKMTTTCTSKIALEIPRDRAGTFDPARALV